MERQQGESACSQTAWLSHLSWKLIGMHHYSSVTIPTLVLLVQACYEYCLADLKDEPPAKSQPMIATSNGIFDKESGDSFYAQYNNGLTKYSHDTAFEDAQRYKLSYAVIAQKADFRELQFRCAIWRVLQRHSSGIWVPLSAPTT
jgi:hypothetical protein